MNFSNFIIEKLSERDSTFSYAAGKSASNPFLFSDIIKVCEKETTALSPGKSENGKTENSLEIFPQGENVINVSSSEFSDLTQLLSSLISLNGKLEPTKTGHKIDDTEIKKIQFVISEEELLELAESFIEKTGFSLIPLVETANPEEAIKPQTLTYKSGSNKLAITINRIKIDENYTNKIINDEFNFVNKLIVNEGLLPKSQLMFKANTKAASQEMTLNDEILLDEFDKSVTDLARQQNAAPTVSEKPQPAIQEEVVCKVIPVDENLEVAAVEEKKEETEDKVFYKAEIIKIETPQSAETSVAALGTENIHAALTSMNLYSNTNLKTNGTNEVNNYQTVIAQTEKETVKAIEQSETYTKQKKAVTTETQSSLSSAESEKTASIEQNITSGKPKEEVNTQAQSYGKATTGKSPDTADADDTLGKLNEAVKTQGKPVNKSEENIAKTAATDFTDKSFATKPIEEKSSLLVETTENETSKPTAYTINDLMDGLTDEEKSVFKSFADQGDVKEIKFEKFSVQTKNVTNLPENPSVLKVETKTGEKQTVTEKSIAPEAVVKSEIKTTNDGKVALSVMIEADKSEFEKNNSAVAVEENVTEEFVGSEATGNSEEIKLKSEQEQKNSPKQNLFGSEDVGTEEATNTKLFIKVSARPTIKGSKVVAEDIPAKSRIDDIRANEVKTKEAEKNPFTEVKYTAEPVKNVNIKSEKGEQVAPNFNTEIASPKEKTTQVKSEAELKEPAHVNAKATNHDAEQQLNQKSENESGKSNSSELFKNHLNQAVSSEKNFEVDNLKSQVDAKQAHEAFKTVKQQEIMPEFSKLILQGEKQTMTLQLTPENLGKVKLTVDMIENQIVTKIEVENEQVKQFVQSNIEQLKQNMQSAGIPLTNVNVSLADDQRHQKVFTPKKKQSARGEKEEVIEETNVNYAKKQMGYNTYEFTA
jgi:flagellar hook-length control protein FliK